jgi:SSS family transporter
MDLGGYAYKWLVLIGILAFFAMRLAIGYWASRRVANVADYVVAGRRLPVYIAAASIMATWFAAETLMGAAATAYQSGFQGVVFDPFGAVLCLLISGVFFIRLMRRARYLTVVDFFERRYGRAMGLLGSLAQLAAYFAWTAAQFVAGGHVLHKLLGLPLPVGMLLVGTVVTLYTTMGGMWADTVLDFIQMFFTAGGIALVFWYVLDAVGGWSGMLADARALNVSDPFALVPLAGETGYLGYTGLLGWMYWAAAWMSLGLGSIACQDLMQRSMSAKNEAASVWGTYLAALLYLVFGVMSPLVGIMMYKLAPDIPVEQLDGLLVMATVKYLPPLAATLFIAALASALMSTSDSSILAGASVVTENIVPFFRPGVGDVQKLRWTRIAVVVNGATSVGIAVAVSNIYRLATISWSLLLVGLFAPFAFGMYWHKANRSGAVAAFLSGFLVWLAGVCYLYPTTRAQNTAGEEVDFQTAIWDAVYIASTPAVLVSVLTLIAVSLWTQRRDPPWPLTDVDGQPLPLRDRLGLLWPKAIF